jgi:hypothetical protein
VWSFSVSQSSSLPYESLFDHCRAVTSAAAPNDDGNSPHRSYDDSMLGCGTRTMESESIVQATAAPIHNEYNIAWTHLQAQQLHVSEQQSKSKTLLQFYVCRSQTTQGYPQH